MSENDSLEDVKTGATIVSEIIKAAGNDPKAIEAASNLGEAAVTITKTINNALLPLAAVNFAFEKARFYFSTKFHDDLSQKASSIPQDYIVEPKASIAGPTLQAIAFTHDEPDLKEMFLNLLATSMDGRIANKAHPSFVEIIKQLSADDASLLRHVLGRKGSLPIVEVRKTRKDKSYIVLKTHLLGLINVETNEDIIDPEVAALVDNWIRLGLVTVTYGVHLGTHNYDWVEGRPEVMKFRIEHESKEDKVIYKKGAMSMTVFGEQFARAVGLLK